MPISEAKKKSNKKWNDANMKERYDRIQLVVPKGRKETLQAHAAANGESLNGFVNKAIDERLERLQGAQDGATLLGKKNILVFDKATDNELSAIYIERETGIKYKIYQDDYNLWNEPKKAELRLSNLYTEYETGVKYRVFPYEKEKLSEVELSEDDDE